jgi:hypothetical protein
MISSNEKECQRYLRNLGSTAKTSLGSSIDIELSIWHLVGGIDAGAESRFAYALKLVRNLRNHVAHGTFPLGQHADCGGYEDSKELVLMLRHACRVSTLYMQIILRWFSAGIESYAYRVS